MSELSTTFVKGKPMYMKSEVAEKVAENISNGAHLGKRDKIKADLQAATKAIDNATDTFTVALERFIALEERYSEAAKRASGSVRTSAEKLSQGLVRIEKLADFSHLEQRVLLLERAAKAIQELADLEAGGKLERLVAALRT